MEEAKYKDIEYKEKVLFEGKVTLNPNSKNTEVANCSVTEGSVIIESTEPLQIPLDRVEECLVISVACMVGRKAEFRPCTVTLRYRTASGEKKKIEFEMNWEEAGNLRATIDMTKGRMLQARRAHMSSR